MEFHSHAKRFATTAAMENLRTNTTKRVIGALTKFAFNDRMPSSTLRGLIDQIGVISQPAPSVELAAGEHHTIPFDFWTPDNLKPGRLLFYSHGGGYTMFSRRTHQGLVTRLAKEFAAQAIAYDYRLAPEHKFPAAIDDAMTMYKYVLELGFNPADIIFAGDSAGGGITFALMLAARDQGLPLPALAIGLSPWLDMTASGASMRECAATDVMLSPEAIAKFVLKYMSGVDVKHPYASPLFGNLQGLPPVLLQAAGDEILRDDSVRLASALRAAGVRVDLDIWPGLFHVFEFAWRWLPEAEDAIVKMGDFVRLHFANKHKGRAD